MSRCSGLCLGAGAHGWIVDWRVFLLVGGSSGTACCCVLVVFWVFLWVGGGWGAAGVWWWVWKGGSLLVGVFVARCWVLSQPVWVAGGLVCRVLVSWRGCAGVLVSRSVG